MAETQYSIRIVKSFTYRNAAQLFSNKYHFDGGAPTDSTAWHALMDAVVLEEQAIFPAGVEIVDAFGYAPGSGVAVASKSYTTAGNVSASGSVGTPGDCAAVVQMATTKRSTKNHPVYVFSYYHGVLINPSNTDAVWSAQVTAIQNYATAWLNGITVGGRTYKRTTPDGHPTTGAQAHLFVGHRDFPH